MFIIRRADGVFATAGTEQVGHSEREGKDTLSDNNTALRLVTTTAGNLHPIWENADTDVSAEVEAEDIIESVLECQNR